MQQISDWLKKLGMSELPQRFAENRIDLAALPDLTDRGLKDRGVILDDRRKILRAIADLKSITLHKHEVVPSQLEGTYDDCE
jgi:SAM domain (Sterile alpha motif)